MNVNDIERIQEVAGDRLEMIFARQKELHDKYKGIEDKNNCGWGILQGKPFYIEDARSQAYVKDLCWRTTEELSEAVEAWCKGDKTHTWEEVADAFHFLVETMIVVEFNYCPIVVGYNQNHPPKDLLEAYFNNIESTDGFLLECLNTITSLGLACNCLKNKPWKQTQMQTDVGKFFGLLGIAFNGFFRLCAAAGIDADLMFQLYFKKSEVNKFRIRSQY